ncbi:MAG: phosphatidate cytidylyltransferase [Candidatus Omnitrophica bacterium]|nr:phosphatidate cytidylyltransferase [Candidatus Omnitrophota bacterium]MDD5437178.1 phosphatidate cytidylyltransferase [Candidatus Omnitrophota bacterium]
MADNLSLTKRISTSFLILTLVALIIFFFPNWVFSILASAMIGIALAEFFNLVARKKIFVYKYFGIVIGMCVPLIIFFQMGGEGYFTLEPFFIVIACLFIFVLQFIRRDSSQALTSIAITLFGLLYIAWFFSFFIKLKFLQNGAFLVTFLVLVTKMGDVGAYLVGNAIGKHNLISRISPHKTVEGTVGGLAFSLMTAVACKGFLPDFPYGHLIVLGILLGILAQVGDLAESLLKRDSGVKDSGSILSGFGGMLDLIDSLLFTTPIFYFYVVVLMKR